LNVLCCRFTVDLLGVLKWQSQGEISAKSRSSNEIFKSFCL